MDDFDLNIDGFTPDDGYSPVSRKGGASNNRPRTNIFGEEPYRPPVPVADEPFESIDTQVAPARPAQPRQTLGQPQPVPQPQQKPYRGLQQPFAGPASRQRQNVPRTETRANFQQPQSEAPSPQNAQSDVASQGNYSSADADLRRSRRERKKEPRDYSNIVKFFTSDNLRVFSALALAFLSIFMMIALTSHFFYGGRDQSAVANLTLTEMSQQPGAVENATGGFGAWLSKILLCDALGLGSLVLIAYVWILIFNLLRIRKCRFWGTTFRCLLLAITISVVLGLVTFNSPTEIYWGGNHGHYINQWIMSHASWIGAAVVSLLLVSAVASVYLNELITVWNKWREVARRRKLQEQLRRERQRELDRIEEIERNERLAREAKAKAAAQAAAQAKAQAAAQAAAQAQANMQAPAPNTHSADSAQSINTCQPTSTLYNQTEELNEEPEIVAEIPVSVDTAPKKPSSLLSTLRSVTDRLLNPTDEDETEEHSEDEDKTVTPDPSSVVIPDISDSDSGSNDDEVMIVIDSEDGGSESTFSVTAPAIEEADSTVSAQVAAAPQQSALYDHRADLSRFNFPTVDLLEDRPSGPAIDMEEQQANKERIEKTLLEYRIPISRIEATVGPTVTLYEIVPAEGVRISQIKRLEDDIALSLSALGIRIIAPIPGKGTVGIEVPNKDPKTVSIRSVLNSKKYQECKMALPMAMGATISNDIFIADLAKMPHLLVAGATGMGKSVGLNTIIASLLYKKHPSELKLVLIDPKMVEFSLYSRLERHYLAKLPNEEEAIITDMKKVIETLNSLCVEMENRYKLLKEANVRSLEEYNAKFSERKLNPEKGHQYLPYIVVIVDEFADLIMTQGKEIETPISRIAQKARAVGMHMILATQRPSTNVITGLIKANFPGRIAFRVIQMVDSRTILDCPGANQLIGRGDMLFSHNGIMDRVQCAFISTGEVEAITEYIDNQIGYEHAYYLPEYVPEESEGGPIAGASMERDALFDEAARFVVSRQMGSTSSLQRQFGIGYNRAGKLMDQMEAAGIVGQVNGSKPRAILVDMMTLDAILGDNS